MGYVGSAGGSIVSTARPSVSNGGTWVDPSSGVFYSGYDNEWHPIPPMAVIEEASTFGESDVSLNLSKTEVSGSKVQLKSNARTETISTPSDNGSNGWSAGDGVGLLVNPNTSMSGLAAKISSNSSGYSVARLKRHSDNTVLDSVDISGYSTGDWVNFNASLSSGTTYQVIMDNDSANYTAGTYGSPSFPYSGTDFDITNGYEEYGSNTVSERYAWVEVARTEARTDGSVTVSWPSPSDISAWDLATFQHTLDGESITIDVLDGSGSVLFSDIGQNFDISTVATSTDVQMRANLSRADTANNPTLDYAARRFVQ